MSKCVGMREGLFSRAIVPPHSEVAGVASLRQQVTMEVLATGLYEPAIDPVLVAMPSWQASCLLLSTA